MNRRTDKIVVAKTSYWPDQKPTWKLRCPGNHGGCNGWWNSLDTFDAVFASIDEHLAAHRPHEMRCQSCAQLRMCFPHRQVQRYHLESHDCPSCACEDEVEEKVVNRMYCTRCWSNTDPVVEIEDV